MIYVIDASVAVKWFVEEEGREKATSLLRRDIVRFAPDIILVEVANTVRRKVGLGEMTVEQASFVIDDLSVYLPSTIPAEKILWEALAIGIELNHALADCLYLACALHVGGCLVSADEIFLTKCRPKYSDFVVSLNDLSLPAKLTGDIRGVVDADMLDTLVQLSAVYQQTKDRIGRHWFNSGVVALAEQRLLNVIKNLDTDQRAYLTAVCWLGAIGGPRANNDGLLKLWSDRLAYAKTTMDDPRDDIAYLIPRLQSLDTGLRLLSTLNSTNHSD